MIEQTVIPPARPQRPMMIKGLVPRLPERGHIKIGMKGEMITSQGGKQFQPPQKLDHFRVTTLERGKDGNFLLDAAFHEKYGERPTEIPVRLLYDSPELNYPTRYACFIGRTLWCTGDGESAIRLTTRPDELKTPNSIAPREVPCTCSRQEPTYQGSDRCKINGSLSVLIEGMGGIGGVWKFRTTSWNSVVGILSSMQFLRSVTSGVLANIPLVLRVQPKQATNPQSPTQSVTIYVVSLEFAGDIAELQQYAHQIALDRATTHMSITNIEEEARRVLMIEGPANTVLPGDNADEVVEEFYPEQVDAPVDAPARPTREQFAAPQAPLPIDAKNDSASPLSEAEEAELADIINSGDAAAKKGSQAFAKFWNAGETKAYRNELAPHLDAWAVVAKAADEPPGDPEPFEVVDMVGDVLLYPEAGNAVAAYRVALDEAEAAKGEAGLTPVWDNNQGLMRHLDELGMGDLTKELSTEYGERRQAAANREAAVREIAEKNAAGDRQLRDEAEQLAAKVFNIDPIPRGIGVVPLPDAGHDAAGDAATRAARPPLRQGKPASPSPAASQDAPVGDLLATGNTGASGAQETGAARAETRPRSNLWREKSYAIEPAKDRADHYDWPKYGADLAFLVTEAGHAELTQLRRDNGPWLALMRRENGDAARSLNEAIETRFTEIAADQEGGA